MSPEFSNGSAAPGSQSGGRADMIIVDIDTDILIDAARCTYFLIGGILQTVWEDSNFFIYLKRFIPK